MEVKKKVATKTFHLLLTPLPELCLLNLTDDILNCNGISILGTSDFLDSFVHFVNKVSFPASCSSFSVDILINVLES